MIAASVFLLMALGSADPVATTEKAPLDCQVGPVTKTFGRTDWLVYSCSDNRTIVVVAKPENPAFEFYFILTPESDSVKLYGEGVGDKAATEPAFEDLKQLSAGDVAAIVAETKRVGS
jgi:hypothetical protein